MTHRCDRYRCGVGFCCTVDVVISSASGTERGEVFYGPTDWLGSRDPMTPYDTHLTHLLDWMTETLTVPLTDDSGLITDTCIMLTVYDR